jgi:hypothetical protein
MSDQPSILDAELDNAASLLRSRGWVVVPPAPEKPPEPEVGQTWASPKPRIEPRTVVKLGPGRAWQPDVPCVYFTTPSRQPDPKWGPNYLTREAWDAWVRKSEARPA